MSNFKKIIDFGTDSLLVLVLIFIVGISFIATYSLNPKAKEGLKQSVVETSPVLGTSIDTNVTLKVEDIANQSYLMTTMLVENDSSYLYSVKLANLKNPMLQTPILKIKNNTPKKLQLLLQSQIPEQYLRGMTYSLLVLGQEYQLYNDSSLKQLQDLVLDIKENSEFTLEMKIASKVPISYPLEFDLIFNKFN